MESSADSRTVGDRIAMLCALNEIKQAELARAVGCSPMTISNIRHNKVQNPRGAVLDQIAAYFNVDDRWLRTGVPRDAPADDEPDRNEFQGYLRDVGETVTDENAMHRIRRAIQLVLEEMAREGLSRKGPRPSP